MQLAWLVVWTIVPPSGSAQWSSAGPKVAFPAWAHIEAPTDPTSDPLSLVDPTLETELAPSGPLSGGPAVLLDEHATKGTVATAAHAKPQEAIDERIVRLRNIMSLLR